MDSIFLSFAQSSVVFELQHYKFHAQKVEDLLEQEMVELRKAHDEMTKDWDPYERAEFFENSHDEYWELGKIYPDIQRKSGVISIYSVLEKHLNSLCHLYTRLTKTDILLSDFGENDIVKRAQVYLTKVAKIDFPKEHETWREIQLIQQIRNKLVHADGVIPTGNQVLIGYIKNCPHLSLDPHNKITLGKGFVAYCSEIFSSFFEELFSRN